MDFGVVAPLAASEIGVAGISAGAALLGAAVGGFATYRVERSRQDHERTLEQQRYDREEATRGREDLDFARGVARVLRDDLDRAVAHAESEKRNRKWIPERTSAQLSPEDRRELFRHLEPDEYQVVVRAERTFASVSYQRQLALANLAPARRTSMRPPTGRC
jgi:hypothetical protein